ncbi:uncharacterized protein B0J16DRAFT_145367 [Fusarium flagelliforme]|uniref:Uncharacterized protein n=1 Tax=Fusarium flagelliforme TaxID=2675880 RepID=A0A395M5Q9_9HYPO|nr:uncharacterized protein B0J16DRAFT_145367 [Fusarium flagelliforme]KAH7185970.1 hypothetical protein B0J16DRAFT_145367 [Fusarium flagelliforme]RFN43221.1 hypothetical protein FIE12Z_12542 [Fusarium flagelliforme]
MDSGRKRKLEDVSMADSTEENNQANRPAKQWKATIPMMGDMRTGSNNPQQQRNDMQLNRPPQQWKATITIMGTRRTEGKDTNNPEEKQNDAPEDKTAPALREQGKRDDTVDQTADEDNNAEQRQDDTSTEDEDKESTGSEPPMTERDRTTDEERNPEDVTTPPSDDPLPSAKEEEQNQDRDRVWIPTMFMTETDKENLGPYMKAGIITILPPMVHSYTVKLGDDIHQQYHIHLRIHEAFSEWWKRVASHLGARQCNKQRRPQAFLHEKRKFYYFKWSAVLFKLNDAEDKEKLVGFGVERFQNLHPHHIHALVRTLCHPSVKETMLNNSKLNELTLWVRFGLMSPPDEALNTDLNRFAYLDQVWRAAPSKMSRWGRMMGATLAILHWKCNLDAQGVNFKIGRISRYFVGLILENPKHVQSFDPEALCAHSLARQIVSNPVWPRPVSAFLPQQAQRTRLIHDVWESFSDAYLSASKKLLSECESEHIQGLPTSVLWWVCQLGVISPMYLDNICHELLHKRLR